MTMRCLIIVCGIPGSGKSTLARRAVERWGAVSFASESFADALGAAARTAAGDLSREAIVHAYSAMADAVAESLSRHGLVVAVGSFRSAEQRRRFREIATRAGASATTLRVVCPVATAAERVRSRLASGERGPSAEVLGQIDAELNRASDIDALLTNDASMEQLHGQVDALIQAFLTQAPLDPSLLDPSLGPLPPLPHSRDGVREADDMVASHE
jgi:predicted kinase